MKSGKIMLLLTTHFLSRQSLAEPGIGFATKAELQIRPYMIISFVMMVSIAIFGAAMRAAELSYMDFSGQNWKYH